MESSGSGASSRAGATPVSLPLQVEQAITIFLYKEHASTIRAARSAGLVSPLWLWTHACYIEADRIEKCVNKAFHLLRWMQRNRVDMHSVAVVCTQHTALQRLRAELDASAASCGSPYSPSRRAGGSATSVPANDPLVEQLTATAGNGAGVQVGATLVSSLSHVTLRLPHDALAAASAASPATQNPVTTAGKEFSVVLFLLSDAPSESQALRFASSRMDEFLAANLAACRTSFVWIADAAWTAPSIGKAWKSWGMVVQKLIDQALVDHPAPSPLPASAEAGQLPAAPSLVVGATAAPIVVVPERGAADGKPAGLCGPKLPVCCGVHTAQRDFITGLQDVARTSFCRRYCLRGHLCRNPHHPCDALCHPTFEHRHCPYACDTTMPCGHTCKKLCGQPCNCYTVEQVPLPCSHQVVVGLDQATQQPLYLSVPHLFHGVCVDRELPCVVAVPTICGKCLGPFVSPCHVLTAAGHTMEQRTVSCPDCVKLERDTRAAVLAEVLVGAEQKKKDMKTALTRTVHEQTKSASSGVFRVGARVVITDVTKIIAPLDPEADFPGKIFIDLDVPVDELRQKLHGVLGIIESQHVDVDDPTELRSAVRLATGKYALVADGGMEFVRADVSSVVGGSGAQTAMLLLTGPTVSRPPAQRSEGNGGCENEANEAGNTAESKSNCNNEGKQEDDPSPEEKELAARKESMLGKWFACLNTVVIHRRPRAATAHVKVLNESDAEASGDDDDECRGGDREGRDDARVEVSELLVRVIGDDPQHRPEFVMVEAVVLDRDAANRALEDTLTTETTAEAATGLAAASPPVAIGSAKKRPRSDDAGDDSGVVELPALQRSDDSQRNALCSATLTLQFPASLRDLDPLPFAAPPASTTTKQRPSSHVRFPFGEELVRVTNASQQLTSVHQLNLVRNCLESSVDAEIWAALEPDWTALVTASHGSATLSTIAPTEAFTIRAIVNAPLYTAEDLGYGFRPGSGPFCVLEGDGATNLASGGAGGARYRPATKRRAGGVAVAKQNDQAQRDGGVEAVKAAARSRKKLVVVPLHFVAPDELASAMTRLDAEAMEAMTALVDARLAAALDARALRNDELAYQQQLAMLPLTDDALLELQRQQPPAVSKPNPLLEKDALLLVEKQCAVLPRGAAATRRLLEAKDAAQRRLEQVRARDAAKLYEEATREDRAALHSYVESCEKKFDASRGRQQPQHPQAASHAALQRR